jgi:hypothetical protein
MLPALRGWDEGISLRQENTEMIWQKLRGPPNDLGILASWLSVYDFDFRSFALCSSLFCTDGFETGTTNQNSL